MVFLLTVVLSSSFISIQSSRPAQAESLLYTVGCVVGSLLSRDCPPSQTKPQPNPPPKETQPSPPSEPTTSPDSPSAQQPTNNPAPVELDDALTAQLPTIPELHKGLNAGSSTFVLPNVRAPQYPSAQVLGAHDAMPLRATTEGWRIYGFAWYWWLIALGSVVGAYIGIKFLITKSFLGIVK